jgi:hypothetical protein
VLTLNSGTPPLVLTAALFPNPFDITKFTFLENGLPSEVDQAINTSVSGVNRAANALGTLDTDNQNKKKDDDKKGGPAVCR